jgi:hypothetical protein
MAAAAVARANRIAAIAKSRNYARKSALKISPPRHEGTKNKFYKNFVSLCLSGL